MKVINIDPIMKEIEKDLDQSLFETDVSTCFIACALRKKLQECPQIDIDTESILERFDHECVEESNKKKAFDNLYKIFIEILDKLREIEFPGE